MKKLIAVFVVFALVAGAVFAQPNLGGQVKAGATLLHGSSEVDSAGDAKPAVAGGRYPGNVTEGIVNVSAGDADLGAFVRVLAKADGDYFSPQAFAFAWWKPSDSFKIQFGHNPDGNWGAGQITGWGFNAEAQDFVALDNDTGDWRDWGLAFNQGKTSHADIDSAMLVARGTGFYQGIKSESALLFEMSPADGLGINIGFPFGKGTGSGSDPALDFAASEFMKLHFQVNYTIQDIGKIFFTYQGNGLKKNPAKPKQDGWEAPDYAGGNIFLSFYLMAIDGLGVDIGLDLPLDSQTDGKAEKSNPLGIGLGVTYAADDFGVKFRFGAQMGGTWSAEGKDPRKDARMGFTVLPYYRTEALTVFFQAGLGMYIPEKDTGMGKGDDGNDAIVGWFVNPYIAIPAGGAKIFAGVKIYSDGIDRNGKTGDDPAPTVSFAIPVGINFYF